MSNKTIHELDSLSEIAQNDEMLIYDISAGADNPTKKTTAGNLLNFIKDKIKDVYSTDEVKTNKVWIDGKPIYRKVYTGTASNGTSVLLDINNLDKVLNFDGILYYGSPIQVLKLNNPNDSGYMSRVHINGNAFNFLMGSWANLNFYIFIEYTKTTD